MFTGSSKIIVVQVGRTWLSLFTQLFLYFPKKKKKNCSSIVFRLSLFNKYHLILTFFFGLIFANKSQLLRKKMKKKTQKIES